MTSGSSPPRIVTSSFGPLSAYIEPYLLLLKERGYAIGSFYEQVCVLKIFGRWLGRTGRGVKEVDEEMLARFLRTVPRGRYPGNAAPSTLRRLLTMLRSLGVVAIESPDLSPLMQFVRGYERFLTDERHLHQDSVVRYGRIVSKFLSDKFGTGPLRLRELRSTDVTGFVQRCTRTRTSSDARKLVVAMRAFLRFIHYKGMIDRDLSTTVPKVARWALSPLPKHLPATQVQRMLRHCERRSPRGRRNYAILLLLARLGLRAGEVVGLNLEDLDWDQGRITVCGKGRRTELPLPPDVAKAIASYLRRGRLPCASRRVFLRDYAPVDGFGRASAIGKIVSCALAKAEVKSARKGAHLLRHSLATEMLRKGASLDEIGEVLRHRSSDTTAIYAKVDLNALQKLALPWPGGVR